MSFLKGYLQMPHANARTHGHIHTHASLLPFIHKNEGATSIKSINNYPPRSHCRASIVAAFSYLEVVITLCYRACAKENAKNLPKQFASNGAWNSLSLGLDCPQWRDSRPSALPDILVREYCYNPQWRIKWGSDRVQKEGFNTTGSPRVIGITAYAHDQLQEESLFPFDYCFAYLHARDHLGPKALIQH